MHFSSYRTHQPPASTPAPIFSAQSAPAANVSTAYSYTFVASNTTSYALGTGSLPAGLTLSSAGVLSGTPTTAASYTFTVIATGPGGSTSSTSQSVNVTSGAVPGAPQTMTVATLGSYLMFVRTVDGATGSPTKYYFESSPAGANTWTVFNQAPATIVLTSCFHYFPSSPSTSFDFRCRAQNASGLGPYSAIVTGSTAARVPIATAPTVSVYGWTGDDGTNEDPATAAAYAAGTTYQEGQVVASGGSKYICTAPTTGNAPPNATYWRLVTTVYYVSNTGSDANNGLSSATPFLTLDKLREFITVAYLTGSPAPDGTMILLKRGDTFDGVLYVQTSAGLNYMIGSYGTGVMPKIVWNTVQAWQTRSGVLSLLSNKTIVRHLYIACGALATAGTSNIQTFTSNQPATVHSCDLRNAKYAAVRCDDAVNVSIKNCNLMGNGNSAVAGTNWNGFQLIGNTWDSNGTSLSFEHHLYLDSASTTVIRGNLFTNGTSNYAIVGHGSCGENIIDQNRITLCNNGIGLQHGYIANVSNEQIEEVFPGTQITRNIIENCGRNTGQNQGIGMYLDSLPDLTIANNTFRNNAVIDLALSGYGGATGTPTSNADIAFNSFVNGSTTDPSVKLFGNGAMTGLRFRDNAMHLTGAGGQALLLDTNTLAAEVTLTNNRYYAAAGTSALYSWRGTTYASLATFQAGVAGKESGSSQGDPLFTNTIGNFALQAGSACKLAGAPITNLTSDLPGTTRNVTTPSIGAYE